MSETEASVRMVREMWNDSLRIEAVFDRMMLQMMGRESISFATEKLGEGLVTANRAKLQEIVAEFMLNREWAEPIIRQAIHDAARELLREILTAPSTPPRDDERRET